MRLEILDANPERMGETCSLDVADRVADDPRLEPALARLLAIPGSAVAHAVRRALDSAEAAMPAVLQEELG